MSKKPKNKLLKYWLTLVILVAIGVIEVVAIWHKTDNLSSTSAKSGSNSASSSDTTSQPPVFNKNLYSINNAASLWVIVNKGRVLPSSYVPASLVVPDIPLRLGASSLEMHLRSDSAAALEQMFSGAKTDGIKLMLASGYRSYANQVSTYNGFAKTDGVARADTYSARPGHSEHQTGLAADVEPTSRKCEFSDCFGDTAEGKWLLANAYKYGFIIRYQKGAQNLTGYQYEPWHVRYVGKELAAQVYASGQTLEQFFDLPNFIGYPAQMYNLK